MALDAISDDDFERGLDESQLLHGGDMFITKHSTAPWFNTVVTGLV